MSRRPTFAALAVPNYRRYLGGQVVSLVGTWMQAVGQAWLVLQLSHSGTVLGLVIAVQLLPMLVLGPYGGLIVDRIDKRRLLLAANVLSGALALALGLLAVSGAATLAMVFVLAFALGLVRAFAAPAQQAFPAEMVSAELLGNAVSLNSVVTSAARAVGPAAAGALIATAGVGVCFLVNAASFAAVVVALARLNTSELRPPAPIDRAPGQIREGWRYVRATPALSVPLAMMAIVGTLAYEFPVTLPLMAAGPLGGGPGAYGLMTSAMGVGAVAGGLRLASRARTGLRPLGLLAALFGVSVLAAAVATSLAVELVALVAVGAASVAFLATASSTLQLTAEPQFRGRVMALWSMAFFGTTPIGGPLVGAVCEAVSPQAGLVVGAAACLACAGLGFAADRRLRTTRAAPGAPGRRVALRGEAVG